MTRTTREFFWAGPGRGFKGVVASNGALGLTLARQFRPSAVSLDIFLPDMLGWTVLNRLKSDPLTRHIPV
jgi:CheY-like chemotaxis protein